jgi:hypothetical protein
MAEFLVSPNGPLSEGNLFAVTSGKLIELCRIIAFWRGDVKEDDCRRDRSE